MGAARADRQQPQPRAEHIVPEALLELQQTVTSLVDKVGGCAPMRQARVECNAMQHNTAQCNTTQRNAT